MVAVSLATVEGGTTPLPPLALNVMVYSFKPVLPALELLTIAFGMLIDPQ